MVFSRPIRSDTQPKNGRVSPLQNRSIVSASGSAAMPHTTSWVMPKSAANTPICDVTISPDVDIRLIITNISQKIGVLSMSVGATSRSPRTTLAAVSVTGGDFSPSAAMMPITPRINPQRISVAGSPADASVSAIGNVVAIAPMPYPAATTPAANPRWSGNQRTIWPTTPI